MWVDNSLQLISQRSLGQPANIKPFAPNSPDDKLGDNNINRNRSVIFAVHIIDCSRHRGNAKDKFTGTYQ